MAGIYRDHADNVFIGPCGMGLPDRVTIRGYAKRTWLSFVALAFALSGCGLLGGDDNAASGFASVSGNQINRELSGETNRTISDPSVGLVAFMTGYELSPGYILPEVTIYAFSGIAPGYDTGTAVASGTASYDARYAYEVVDDFDTSFFGVSGHHYSAGGAINLTADFGAGTLTGTASRLTVDGVIRGSNLSGSVEMLYDTGTTPESLSGTLTGYIGDTGTIGAFHGNDDDTAAAGGFVGTAN